MELTQEQKKLLKYYEFKKVSMNDEVDPNDFYYQKKMKHPFFKGLSITVCNSVSVWCNEPKKCGDHGEVGVYNAPFSCDELKRVMVWIVEAGI